METLGNLVITVGLVAFLVGLAWLLLALVRRTRKRSPSLLSILGFLLFILGAAIVPAEEPASGDLLDTESTLTGIGSPVTSANWEISVPEEPQTSEVLGDSVFTTKEPKGIFLVIPLTIKNIGDRGSTFSDWQLTLIDEQGREHDPADFSVQLAAGGEGLFLESINPGITHSDFVVFDVPKDISRARLKVEGSLFATPGLIDLGEIT